MSLQQLVECELDGRVGHQQEGGLGPVPQSPDPLLHRYLDQSVQQSPVLFSHVFLHSGHLEPGVDNPQGVRQ